MRICMHILAVCHNKMHMLAYKDDENDPTPNAGGLSFRKISQPCQESTVARGPRGHIDQDPTFWFNAPRQGRYHKPWFVGSLCLCGLLGPLQVSGSSGQNQSTSTPGGLQCSFLAKT